MKPEWMLPRNPYKINDKWSFHPLSALENGMNRAFTEGSNETAKELLRYLILQSIKYPMVVKEGTMCGSFSVCGDTQTTGGK